MKQNNRQMKDQKDKIRKKDARQSGAVFFAVLFSVVVLASCVLCGCSLLSSGENENSVEVPSSVAEETVEESGFDIAEDYPKDSIETLLSQIAGGKVLYLSQISGIGDYDPALAQSVPDQTVVYHISEGLFRTVEGKTVPAGASEVGISEDGLTYTFHLNPEAKWSDQVPVTAADYEYGIRRWLDPSTASPTAYLGAILENGAAVADGSLPITDLGVHAVDDNTLVITLSHSSECFLTMLQIAGFCPVRRDIVEMYGDRFATAPGRQVYNGPFILKAIAGQRIILEKNPYYWDAHSVHLDHVVINTAIDGEAAYQMFLRGELDYVDVPYMRIDQHPDAARCLDGAVDFVGANMDSPYLGNRNLRLAISYALNRETLCGVALGSPSLRYVLGELPGSEGQTYGELFPYEAVPLTGDADQALMYLEKALAELDCEASEICLSAIVLDSAGSRAQAKLFVEQVGDVLGIEVELTMVPYAVRNEMMATGCEGYDMIFAGWSPDYPDVYNCLELFCSDRPYNFIHYNSEEFDALLRSSEEQTGLDRLATLFEAEKRLLDDAAIFVWQEREDVYLTSERTSGIGKDWYGHSMEYLHADVVNS